MNSILYVIAVILLIGWAIGVFAYSVGGIIHALLVIAIIAIIYNLVTGKKAI
ncbi:MAG: lmo0937 family membrane protein [Bacteroidota bacterium]